MTLPGFAGWVAYCRNCFIMRITTSLSRQERLRHPV